MQEYIKINRDDNVAVALRDMSKGEKVVIDGNETFLEEDIARGHKFTLIDIAEGMPVIKYGFPIGYTTEYVKRGSHVHVHNIKTGLGDDLEYEYHPACVNVSSNDLTEEEKYFYGYERADGRVGIRNEIWIIPTVGCVNSIASDIAGRCKDLTCDSIDDVVSFEHPYGCSQMGDDEENTRLVLTALMKHPNAGGVLVLGLGCENSNIEVLKPYLNTYDSSRIKFLQCQDVEDEVAEGVSIVEELAALAKNDVRTKIPVDKLVVGLKCGGSDGLSGITANPSVGILSDIVTSAGGSTILTEVPEMFGAETILMDRCKNKEIFEKTVKLINDFKDYYRRHGQTIYENPSPGNKKGGISTLEDKALGCTQKSGSSQVVDVLAYGECVKEKGLNLLSAPGNDLVASTALAVSGAQIVLFTTGRGTPFASAVPTVKISTNTPLAVKKKNWIDFDAGRLLEEGMNVDIIGKELYDYVLVIANGKKVKSEEKGYHDLAIFKQGVTL